jgi:hypothetical protein
MKKEQFQIGTEFYTGSGKWRCTDVGTRVIVAMRIDPVCGTIRDSKGRKTRDIILNEEEATIAGWFNGPPYAVGEDAFDEYDQEGCYLTKEEVP